MSKSHYKYVIFDLDGTLIDTDLYVVSNYAHMYRKYKPGNMNRLANMIYFSGPPLEEVFSKEFPDVPKEELFREFTEYSKEHANEYATLYDDERECLDEMIKEGYILSVCTSKRMMAVKDNFNYFGLMKYFTHIISNDDVSKQKPDPEGINECITRLGASKDEVLYIGDSDVDILAGNAANVDVGIVTWGLKTLCYTERAKYKLASYKEIQELLCHK